MAIDKQQFVIELHSRPEARDVFPVRYVRTVGRDGGCGIAFDRENARRMSAAIAEQAVQTLDLRGAVTKLYDVRVVPA